MQVVEAIKFSICRDSASLSARDHSPIKMSDFTPEMDRIIKDMLDTVLRDPDV